MGGLAFILTGLYVALMFPVFYRVLNQRDTSSRLYGLTFFIATVKYASWLVYLWPIEDLFLLIAIMLEMINTFIFLLLAVWIRTRNNISNIK
jgi:hypothetical protein